MNRQFTAADYERATAYPFERPGASFHFRGGSANELEPGAAPPRLGGERRALIAIGANASPRALRRKLADLSGDDAELLVATGTLRDVAIAPSAHLAIYGALPSTLLRVPGASARAALMLVTDAQLEAIGITEFNYHVVRLPAADFTAELAIDQFEDPLAYVSSHGAFAPDGAHLGDLTQAEVLDRAAAVVLGESADGRELVRRTIEDYGWAVRHAIPRLGELALPVGLEAWELVSTARSERSQ